MTSIKTTMAIIAVAIIALVGCFYPQSITNTREVIREQVEKVGGITNYDQIGIATTTASSSAVIAAGTAGATTTVNLGKVCYTVTTSAGATVFYWYGLSGNVASSTVSCN